MKNSMHDLSAASASERSLSRRSFLKGSCALAVSAAVFGGLPQLGANAAGCDKGYVSTMEHVPVYSDAGLTQKIGSIFGDTDEIIINFVSDDRSVINVTYPTSSGSKTGFINSSSMMPTWRGVKVNSAVKATTYKWPTGSATYGYIAKGDLILLYCAADQNGRYRVIYPTSSGYKYAWVNVSDSDRIRGLSSESTGSGQKMSEALYQNSSARLTCGFNGYTNTKGMHEGIDFALSQGASVYALSAGEVINVISGARGANGLSQIAVYMPSLDKTVIYLHIAPLVSVGQHISRGQKIATQDWRGISSSSSTHTHVEMRPGKRTRAAKSVNDYTLENPDPTSFWNEQGYTVG